MYENIIGQNKVITLLKNDIERGSLSNSMIFHGPTYSGKLTAALETVRALNCNGDRSIGCQCDNCQKIRSLNFEGMLFMSRRPFTSYIDSLVSAFESTGKMETFDNLRRYIRLMFMSFSDNIAAGAISDSDMNSIHKLQEKAYEILEDNYDTYRSFKSLGADTRQKLSDDLHALIGICEEISDTFKKPSIPVDMIRNALAWSYINQPNINRVIIIDMADYLDDSSRNVLLKRLEEPSPSLFFILIAENKNRIIQTILSRCRCYFFGHNTKEETSQILSKTFSESKQYESVEQYMLRNDETAYNNMLPTLIKVINYVFNFHHTFGELEAFLQKNNDKKYAKALVKNLSILINRELLTRETDINIVGNGDILRNVSTDDLTTLNKILSDTYIKMDIYNLTPVWALEGIFYPIKSLVNTGKIKC